VITFWVIWGGFVITYLVGGQLRDKRKRKALGGSLKSNYSLSIELPVDDTPVLRTTLSQPVFHDNVNPYFTKILDANRWNAAVDKYDSALERYYRNSYSSLSSLPSKPMKENYYINGVKPEDQKDSDNWKKTHTARTDIKLYQEMRRIFNNVSDTKVKMTLQLIMDNTFVPMVELRKQAGEDGIPAYDEQIDLMSKAVVAIEKRYRQSLIKQQAVYTHYLRDLNRELTPEPVKESTLSFTKETIPVNSISASSIKTGDITAAKYDTRSIVIDWSHFDSKDLFKTEMPSYQLPAGYEWYRSVNIDGSWWEVRQIVKKPATIQFDESIKRVHSDMTILSDELNEIRNTLISVRSRG
jgi:hypothetical protein